MRIVAVQYTDKLPDVPPLIQAVSRKRRSFSHEQEIRALITDASVEKEGVHVTVDLLVLVDSIYLLAPSWQRDVLESEVRIHGLNKPVIRSSLYDQLRHQRCTSALVVDSGEQYECDKTIY